MNVNLYVIEDYKNETTLRPKKTNPKQTQFKPNLETTVNGGVKVYHLAGVFCGASLTLYSTAEVDFDIGGAENRTGTRLTRLDVSAVSKLSSFLTLRAGLDHWERPDNRAERDLLVIEDYRLFDRGYWRYWIGSDQGLPWNLRLSEEVALIDSPDYDYDPRWRVGLTRTGLFSWPDATATVTVYNLDAQGMDGYGGRLSAYLPLFRAF